MITVKTDKDGNVISAEVKTWTEAYQSANPGKEVPTTSDGWTKTRSASVDC